MAGRRRIFARSLWAFGRASIQYSRFVLFMAGTGWNAETVCRIVVSVAGRVVIVSGKSDPRFGINFNVALPTLFLWSSSLTLVGDEIPNLHRI
jgi:hypothetical protein